MSKRMVMAADIGNSRTKLLAGEMAKAIEYKRENNQKKIEKILREYYSENICTAPPILAYSSVNPPMLDLFSAVATSLEIEMFDALTSIPNFPLISFDNIKGMGSDRIFGLIGARMRTLPPFITADCGTAITINAVDKAGKCIGGVIFTGFQTQLAALAEKTANLHTVPLFWEEFSPGINTEQAIRRGIVHSIIGGAVHIIKSIAREIGEGADIPVFLTGGGAELMREDMRRRFNLTECPNLVCEGILSVAEHCFASA